MQKLRVHMLDLKSYYPSPAYQLALLVAYAQVDPDVRKGAEFVFTEHPRHQPAQEIAATVLETGADLVCMSNYAWTHKKVCQLLDVLTRAGVALPRILVGGPSCAGPSGDELLSRYPMVSALVDGEGEPAFLDICRAVVGDPGSDPFAAARNCAVRGEAGTIVRANMNHRIQQLDDIPSPYLTGVIPPGPAPLFYETNRGCPYRCAFCYWGNGNAKVFRLSHARIREELEFFARHRVAAFWLTDANFGMFPDDADFAEMLVEINTRHGHPFTLMGVNWAKNSSDRVLELASILKRGHIGCTTTLALQTVTREAEQKARRYSMKPSRFAGLISRAEQRQVDTYTDIVWGLPGESVEEYLDGLDAVIATGVPIIMVHQLYLIPGTELYNDREKFGLVIGKHAGDTLPEASERSEYFEYIVIEHPKMPRQDWMRGNRIQGINHVLHNHDLGKVVSFYLARYGKTHRDVYAFFDRLLLGQVPDFPEAQHPIFSRLRDLLVTSASTIGLDEIVYYRQLSETVWFESDDHGRAVSAEPAVRAFMQAFFTAFCREHGICATREEADLLADIVDYNVLVSPKPAWRPRATYEFSYDVDRIWGDMLTQVFEGSTNESAQPGEESGSDAARGQVVSIQNSGETWLDRAHQVRVRVARMLTAEYLNERRGPVSYTVENPWTFLPSRTNTDWIFSGRSRHCRIVAARKVEYDELYQ
jgi:radical SAM superfamily enzyme YgiQ (UPF0313 family)